MWKNTCTARAASSSARSFSHARAACVATASCISPSSVTGRENDRLRTIDFRAGGAFSSGMHERPRSSCTVLSPVTRRCCRTHTSSSSRRSHAVRTPSPGSRRPYARPIPHTSSTAVVRRPTSRSASVIPQSETQGACPRLLSTLAYALPIFASVFVSAIATRTGIPVHRSTRARISSARAVSRSCSRSAARGTERERNASSMLYTSTSGLNVPEAIHHPAREVGVERVVRREDGDSLGLQPLPHLEERRPHRHPYRLHLLAPRHDAPVVVREHGHGHAREVGPEEPLARDVEVRAVDEAEEPARSLAEGLAARHTAAGEGRGHGWGSE